MTLQRLFTLPDRDAYETLGFTLRPAVQPDEWDTPSADQPKIEVPEDWTGLTAAAFARVALAKQDVPKTTQKITEGTIPLWLCVSTPVGVELEAEQSARQVFDRVAGAITYQGWKIGYFEDEAEAATFCDELKYLLAKRAIVLPDSLLKSLGLKWAYGRTAHCITLESEKFTDLPMLTPEAAEALSSIAKTKLVQNGLKKLGLSIMQKVPDLLSNDPDLAQTLSEMPFELETAKMKSTAVITEARPPESVRKKLHQMLQYQASPHVLMGDVLEEWSPCAALGPVQRVGSDAVYPFVSDIQPIEVAIDLLHMRDATGSLDVIGLSHVTDIATHTADILLDCAISPKESVRRSHEALRPLAVTIVNLHSFLISQALAFDSDAGRAVAAACMALVTGKAYATSATLAAKTKPFDHFNDVRGDMLRVLSNQRRAVFGTKDGYEGLSKLPQLLLAQHCPDTALLAAARDAWDMVIERGHTNGFRNSTVTALPYGLMPDDDMTAGIAALPRQTAVDVSPQGELVRRLQPCIHTALVQLGYDEAQIADISRVMLGHRTVAHAPGINHALLTERGFEPVHIRRVEQAVPYTEDIRTIFTPWILGEEWNEEGGLFDVLSVLGFKEADISAAQAYCYGTGRIPFTKLKPDHQKIFAAISAEAQIRMAGALQPLTSGVVGCEITSAVNLDTIAYDQLLALADAHALKSIKIEQVTNTTPDFVREALRWIDVRSSAAEEAPSMPTMPFLQTTRYLRTKSRRASPAGPRDTARLKVRISDMQGMLPLSDKVN